MSTIGTYNLLQTLPKIQSNRFSLRNNGLQTVVAPKTVGDKKTASQEDGSNNKAKRKTPHTTSRNKAKTTSKPIIVNPFAKKPLGKMKTGTGKLKKVNTKNRKRTNKPKVKHHAKHKPQNNDKLLDKKKEVKK